MYIDPAIAAMLGRVALREEDALRAYTPGAQPSFDDVGREQRSSPVLDALSAAPPESSYFLERGEDGGVRYTRNGSFTVRNGMLWNADGHPVLGLTRGGALREISVDPVDLALNRARDARIEANGALAYEREVIDPRNGVREPQRVVAGRIALARFAAGTALRSEGSVLSAPPGVAPHVGTPGDGNFASLATMRRESSGIDIDRSVDRLRVAYRELDAVQSLYHARDSVAKTATDLVK